MRVACALVTHLRAKVEMCRHPHLEDSPVLIVDRDPSRTRPVVVDRFRSVSGVVAGMTLEQALSRHANAVVLDADQPHYRRVFGQVLASLQGISDRVEGDDLGTAYVRIDGLEGLYRGEARVVSALLNAVPAYLNPRIGVADAKFPAFVAARTCTAHGAFRVPDDVRAFLAPHTIDLLPVSVDVKSEMHRFGLHTMGAVAAMNRHMLTDRFGPEGVRAWELCNGSDDSPVIPLVFRGVGGRAHLAAVPLLLCRGPVRGGGRSTQEGLCPAGHERTVRRVGGASLCCVRLAVLGEERQVQAAGRLVGEGLAGRPGQAGSGPSPHPRRGRDAHPVRLHR